MFHRIYTVSANPIYVCSMDCNNVASEIIQIPQNKYIRENGE